MMSDEDQIAELRREQDEVRFPYFNADLAWKIGARLHARAERDAMPIAIEISMAGQILFCCSMPGATPDNADWIRRKRAVVERHHCSSLLMKLLGEAKGRSFIEKLALPERDFAYSGGGVPIVVERIGCLGAVVVSGLTQFEDHALAISAMRDVIAEIA